MSGTQSQFAQLQNNKRKKKHTYTNHFAKGEMYEVDIKILGEKNILLTARMVIVERKIRIEDPYIASYKCKFEQNHDADWMVISNIRGVGSIQNLINKRVKIRYNGDENVGVIADIRLMGGGRTHPSPGGGLPPVEEEDTKE